MKFACIATVQDGKLLGFDRAGLSDFIGQNEGRDVEVQIRRAGRRSNQQNRFYWGVITPNCIEAMKRDGVHITPEQLHAYLCMKFIPVTVPDANGEVVTLPGRSSDLNTPQFAEFIEAVIMWAWEALNITIPEPGSQTELNLNAA